MSMTAADLARLGEDAALRLLAEVHELLVPNADAPAPDEADAYMLCILNAAAVLQGYLVATTPEPQCHNVRAMLDRAARVYARRRIGPDLTNKITTPNP